MTHKPKRKTLTEKRFFEWSEDDVAVSLRASSGSYGGGSEVLVISYIPTQSEHSAQEIAKESVVNMSRKEN